MDIKKEIIKEQGIDYAKELFELIKRDINEEDQIIRESFLAAHNRFLYGLEDL